MIERYTLPEMGAIWTEEAKMQAWLEVEIAAVRAWNRLGKIPDEAVAQIEAKAAFDVARVAEIEAITNHDVIAFLTNVAEHVGDASKYVHYGMTSSDMLDTGLALQIKRAGALLDEDLVALGNVLRQRAFEFRDAVQVGRTHGIHAEPITFGMKLGMWAFETSRNLGRLRTATSEAAVGKVSGAVGAYNNVDPRVEELVCDELDLGLEPISNQVVQRDRHAAFLSCLAIIGASLEKFATEIRHLQRTEVREAEEAFGKGQKGSSAMPHKRNPILSERMAGCARVLRGNAIVGLENMALWHERDISHSSAERIVLPDSCILLDYMLRKFTALMNTLVVDTARMLANLDQSYRLVFSGAMLLALVDHGMLREDAYRVVQDCAMRAWSERVDFGDLIKQNPEAMAVLSLHDVDAAMNPDQYVRGREAIFDRLVALEFSPATTRN
ncbi:MAG: adenylosuccinate lyase [Thermoleophilia bacterium]